VRIEHLIASLIDYFTIHPDQIDEWRRANKKTRMERFGPGVIRNRLSCTARMAAALVECFRQGMVVEAPRRDALTWQ
jgi:hypothetical protein